MYLGIDVGTTAVKLVLIDAEQNLLRTESAALSVSRPHPLWSEQDPADWWSATQAAIEALKTKHPKRFAGIRAIGLSGQMHGAVLLGDQSQVLRPAILWNDGRAMEQSQRLLERVDVTRITGNTVMPGFTAPKLLWVQQHEPDIFKQTRKVLLPKDYIRWCLCGDFATDMSDASGTAWLNVQERKWSSDMLAACDLTEGCMPDLFEGNEVTGVLRADLAKRWGLQSHVKVVAGAGDNAASAISLNAINEGDAFLSLGTSGVYFVASEAYHANPGQGVHAFCHCLPHRWHQMSVHLSAASCLAWGAKFLKCDSVAAFVAAAEVKKQTNAIFLPYLSGERTPHNDPYARGVFFGIDNDTDQGDFAQAILEGVAFAFAEGQAAMVSAGVNIQNVSVVGGGARSRYWGEVLATVLNRELEYGDNREVGAALGAAKLAWLSENAGELTKPAVDFTIQPEQQRSMLQRKQSLFHQLYQQLKPSFRDSMAIGENQ